MDDTKNNEMVSVKGTHIITVCDMKDGRAKMLETLIEGVRARRETLIRNGRGTAEALRALWAEYNWYLKQLHARYMVRQFVVDNLTTTVGRGALMQRLAGIVTYTGIVNYCALGSGTNAPVVGNTTLQTETYRKALSSGTAIANVSYLETFFTATEVTGTFEEYGFFIDGSAGANTGQLWNRFLSHVVKTNAQTLNVQSIITFNSV